MSRTLVFIDSVRSRHLHIIHTCVIFWNLGEGTYILIAAKFKFSASPTNRRLAASTSDNVTRLILFKETTEILETRA